MILTSTPKSLTVCGMARDQTKEHVRHIPQFVGYHQVQNALGVSRRTVERMVREGSFPRPVQLAPNRVGWQVETITVWLSERSQGLVKHAVERAEELEPDQLEKQALGLIVKSLEQRSGKTVDATNLTLHMTNSVTPAEFKAAEIAEFANYAERFKDFGEARACILAAWLFARLRPMMEGDDERFAAVLADPAAIESLGRRALHDDDWQGLESEWFAMQRGRSN